MYIGIVLWITGNAKEPTQKSMAAGTMVGLLAATMVAQVILDSTPSMQSNSIQIGLLAAAVVLWGVAGLRGSRAVESAGFGMLSGAWSATGELPDGLYRNVRGDVSRRAAAWDTRPLEGISAVGHR